MYIQGCGRSRGVGALMYWSSSRFSEIDSNGVSKGIYIYYALHTYTEANTTPACASKKASAHLKGAERARA